MKTYLYTVQHSSTLRGCNKTIHVYRLKHNVPTYIGYDDRINTAAYTGDIACASGIISLVDGHKLTDGGYRLRSKKIRLFNI